VLHLYRPRLPSTRAQAIQVFRTCHALAKLGHQVTLMADRGETPHLLWNNMGLSPTPGFNLRLAPIRHPGLAGMWFRREVRRWWRGEPGIILARDKRRLLAAVHAHGKCDHRIILETHELDSLMSDKQTDAKQHELEAACLAVTDALVTNCGGTLKAWKAQHTVNIPTQVCHNATHVERTDHSEHTDGVLVVGSMRHNKGIEAVLAAAKESPAQFRWVGGTKEERSRYGHFIALEPAVPHSEIEHLLGQAAVLLLPLGDNPFSHRFTSPLKLWDYLATDRPIVAAQTHAVDEICRHASTEVFHYAPGDQGSIQDAIQSALHAPRRKPFRRTWNTRATELTRVMQEIS
jgi:hypothetical protein